METLKQPFNPVQIEILNTMAQLNTDSDLIELKKVVSKFFAERADREMEQLWNKGTINSQTIDDWGKEHMRTPYKKRVI